MESRQPRADQALLEGVTWGPKGIMSTSAHEPGLFPSNSPFLSRSFAISAAHVEGNWAVNQEASSTAGLLHVGVRCLGTSWLG